MTRFGPAWSASDVEKSCGRCRTCVRSALTSFTRAAWLVRMPGPQITILLRAPSTNQRIGWVLCSEHLVARTLQQNVQVREEIKRRVEADSSTARSVKRSLWRLLTLGRGFDCLLFGSVGMSCSVALACLARTGGIAPPRPRLCVSGIARQRLPRQFRFLVSGCIEAPSLPDVGRVLRLGRSRHLLGRKLLFVTPLASPSKCLACTAYLVMCADGHFWS